MEANCASNGAHVSLKKSLNPWRSKVALGKEEKINLLDPLGCKRCKYLHEGFPFLFVKTCRDLT